MNKIIPYGIENGIFNKLEVATEKRIQVRNTEMDKRVEFSSLLGTFLGELQETKNIPLNFIGEEEQETGKEGFIPSELTLAMSAIYPNLTGVHGKKVDSDNFIQFDAAPKTSESLIEITDPKVKVLQELLSENIDDSVLQELLNEGENIDGGVRQELLGTFADLLIESESAILDAEDAEVVNSLLVQALVSDSKVAKESDTFETVQRQFSEVASEKQGNILAQPTLRQLKKVLEKHTTEESYSTIESGELLENSLVSGKVALALDGLNEEKFDFELLQTTSVVDATLEVKSSTSGDSDHFLSGEDSVDEDRPIQFNENSGIQEKKVVGSSNRKLNFTREVLPSRETKTNFELADLRNVSNEFRTEHFTSELAKEENLRSEIMDLQDSATIPKLAENIQTLIREDRSEVRIQLKPDHLGDMRIKLSLEKGIMVAEFVVENETVKEIIASQLPQLHTALQDQGAQVGEMMVNIGFQNQEQNEEPPSRSRQPQQQTRMQASGTTSQKDTSAYLGRTTWNQVDLKV